MRRNLVKCPQQAMIKSVIFHGNYMNQLSNVLELGLQAEKNSFLQNHLQATTRKDAKKGSIQVTYKDDMKRY